MRWIYVLKCCENVIYIGETTRLFKRLLQHKNGVGSVTTSDFKPYKLLGIYKLIKDGLKISEPIHKDMYETGFLEDNKSWALELENEITLMWMKSMNTKWDDVYGGKYHVGYRPEENPADNLTLLRPYCKCKMPADINIYNNKKYWRCCKKNNWDELSDFLNDELGYPVLEPCNFYKEYIENEVFECLSYFYEDPKRKELFKNLIKKSCWLKNIPTEKKYERGNCVNCDCYVYFNKTNEFNQNGILYPFLKDNIIENRRLLCKNCFVKFNDKLSIKYSYN